MAAETTSHNGLFDCRDAYVATLQQLAEEDGSIVAVCNDSVGSSKLGKFRDAFPDRLINVGIAEQNMVGVSAGLANGGKIPFVSSASCFLTARALEQIKVDVVYSKANVKLCGMAPGVAYGELGATHHSIEDIAWLRSLADLSIVVPSDPWETGEAIKAAVALDGPVFIRVSRMKVPAIPRQNPDFCVGRAEILRQGEDLTIIANGVMVHRALDAAALLAEHGISVRVINMAWITPLDEEAVVAAARETGAIVTVEEHSVRGGLGSAVAEVVVAHQPVPMKILGFPGFLPTGSAAWLMEHFDLTAKGIADASKILAERKG